MHKARKVESTKSCSLCKVANVRAGLLFIYNVYLLLGLSTDVFFFFLKICWKFWFRTQNFSVSDTLHVTTGYKQQKHVWNTLLWSMIMKTTEKTFLFVRWNGTLHDFKFLWKKMIVRACKWVQKLCNSKIYIHADE